MSHANNGSFNFSFPSLYPHFFFFCIALTVQCLSEGKGFFFLNMVRGKYSTQFFLHIDIFFSNSILQITHSFDLTCHSDFIPDKKLWSLISCGNNRFNEKWPDSGYFLQGPFLI